MQLTIEPRSLGYRHVDINTTLFLQMPAGGWA